MRALSLFCATLLLTAGLPLRGQDTVEQPQSPAPQTQSDAGQPQTGEDGETGAGAATVAAAAIVAADAAQAGSKPEATKGEAPADKGEAKKERRKQELEHIEAPFTLTGGFWNMAVLGFTAGQLTVSFVVLLFAMIFRNLIAAFIFRRLKGFAAKTRFDFDDHLINALEKPASWFILFLGVYVSLAILPFEDTLALLIQNLFHGATMLLIVWAMLRLTDVAAIIMGGRIQDKKSAIFGFIPLLRKTAKAFILCVGALMVIDNMGYNVAGIFATLGLGGAALALASKDTIANFFGSLMIVLDRPFKVGDWIIVGDKVDGDVESIGLRSTKVRTWPKTVMSIPNSILANEYINNWSRMPKRRVKQYVGVTYETSADDMEGVVEDIRQLLREDEGVQQDFILVNFTDFGDSSLDILVYYFTVSTAWLEHMDVRQRINCKIMRAVKARGLSIAFPTRSLYLEGKVARKLAGMNNADPDGRLPGDFGPNAPQ
jgi:MscS family membrane protein